MKVFKIIRNVLAIYGVICALCDIVGRLFRYDTMVSWKYALIDGTQRRIQKLLFGDEYYELTRMRHSKARTYSPSYSSYYTKRYEDEE